MPRKPSGRAERNVSSNGISTASTSSSSGSSQNVPIQLQKANMCFECMAISSDIKPSQQTPNTRLFREIFDFGTLGVDDWIVDITLETCARDAHYQQQAQERIDIYSDEIAYLRSSMKRFQIYNILCEALRFCGDKVILPRVKDANKNHGENSTFLEKFENWADVTQFLRRSSKIRNEDQRWLQMEINKVVESDHFYMYCNQWHELFNVKIPRDQAVHAALTLDDLQILFENAHIFGDKNKVLVETFVQRMHRSIPKEAYGTIPITAGPILNPYWPRI